MRKNLKQPPASKVPSAATKRPPPPPVPNYQQQSMSLSSSISSSSSSAEPAVVDEESDGTSDVAPAVTYYGTVNSYNPAAGFGYLHCESLSREVWFGKQCLPEELQWNDQLPGTSVSFRLEQQDDDELSGGRLRADDDSIRLCHQEAQSRGAPSSTPKKQKQRIIQMASNEAPASVAKKAQKRRRAKNQLDDELANFLGGSGAQQGSSSPAAAAVTLGDEKEDSAPNQATPALSTVRRRNVLRQPAKPKAATAKRRPKSLGPGRSGEAEVKEAPAAQSGVPFLAFASRAVLFSWTVCFHMNFPRPSTFALLLLCSVCSGTMQT